LRKVLVNRALETARSLGSEQRSLRRRARDRADRPPLVLVPSILGTRLVDDQGRSGWGSTRALYGRRPARSAAELRHEGLLEGFTLVPRLWSYDVYGGLVRYLERIGGYVRNESLFVLDYDWRAGIAHAAARLAELIAGIPQATERRVDIVGVSSGGLVARYFLEYGGHALGVVGGAPSGAGRALLRRVICIGTPQRGAFNALDIIANGVRPAPLGRHFTGREIAELQTVWELLPHPTERVFVDEKGTILDLDHFDPDVWTRLRITSLDESTLVERLRRARHLHEALDRSGPADIVVIGGRKEPTIVRALVTGGRVSFPTCTPPAGDPRAGVMYAPGDGMTAERSLCALPELDPARVHWVPVKVHHSLPADPEVHRLIVEALIA
jgi:hypothetical protein